MDDNIENTQPDCHNTIGGASSGDSGEVSGGLQDLQDLLKKNKQPPPINVKMERRESLGKGATTNRELSGLQDLLTPFFTPRDGGGCR